MLRIIHKALLPQERKRQQDLDFSPVEDLQALQWRKLQKLLRIAYEKSPFYQRRFREIGASPQDIRTLSDFGKIPNLTREEVQNHAEEMAVQPLTRLCMGRTGGSTGQPLVFYYDHDYKYRARALKQRAYSWVGAAGKRPALYVWGSTMRTNVPAKILPGHLRKMPAFCYGLDYLDEERLARLAASFRQICPAAIFGYRSLLLALASYLLDRGLPTATPPQTVVSSAENLYPEDRAIMEKAFGTKVYNLYGSHENGTLASECAERRGLHVPMDHVLLEIVAEGRAATAGEPGYLVVTDLDNLAMPFIRYRNEDIGKWSDEDCPCGRSLPMLEAILGRETDFIFDRTGKAYSGINLMRFVEPTVGEGRFVRRAQFLQAEEGRLRLLVVPGPQTREWIREAIRDAMEEGFSHQMEIEIDFVDRIPAEPSGKTRLVKSALSFASVWK